MVRAGTELSEKKNADPDSTLVASIQKQQVARCTEMIQKKGDYIFKNKTTLLTLQGWNTNEETGLKRELLNLRLIPGGKSAKLGQTEHRAVDELGNLFEVKMLVRKKEQQLLMQEKLPEEAATYLETEMVGMFHMKEEVGQVLQLFEEERGEGEQSLRQKVKTKAGKAKDAKPAAAGLPSVEIGKLTSPAEFPIFMQDDVEQPSQELSKYQEHDSSHQPPQGKA